MGLLNYALAGAGKGAADTYLEISKEDRADKKKQEAEGRADARQRATEKRQAIAAEARDKRLHQWNVEAEERQARRDKVKEIYADERWRISETNKQIQAENQRMHDEYLQEQDLEAAAALQASKPSTVAAGSIETMDNPDYDDTQGISEDNQPRIVTIRNPKDGDGSSTSADYKIEKDKLKLIVDDVKLWYGRKDNEDNWQIVDDDDKFNASRSIALGTMYYKLTKQEPALFMPKIHKLVKENPQLSDSDLMNNLTDAEKVADQWHLLGGKEKALENLRIARKAVDDNMNAPAVDFDLLLDILGKEKQGLLKHGEDAGAGTQTDEPTATEQDQINIEKIIKEHNLQPGEEFEYTLEDETVLMVTVQ